MTVVPSVDQEREMGSLPCLTVGNVRIGFPIVLAALSGYSDWAMRVISRRAGAS